MIFIKIRLVSNKNKVIAGDIVDISYESQKLLWNWVEMCYNREKKVIINKFHLLEHSVIDIL